MAHSGKLRNFRAKVKESDREGGKPSRQSEHTFPKGPKDPNKRGPFKGGYRGIQGLGFKGPRDPNKKVLGPKYYVAKGIWALNPYYLGPWTLRACCEGEQVHA